MEYLNHKNFYIAAVISFITAVLIYLVSFIISKNEFFLLMNEDWGSIADTFFKYYTYVGDGLMWLPLLLLFILHRRRFIPLLISVFIFSTLFTQLCKYVILPNEPRPIKAIADLSIIHTVPGVELHEVSSFPSGHTTTAFCFYFIVCLVLAESWTIPLGFAAAILLGYSRVYLAQHFPFDVAAGIVTAIVSVLLALPIQAWWSNRFYKEEVE
jgi:membrane-associated phospholipid phosphatase